MAFKTWSAFDVITSSDVNTYLMQQAFIVCTVATRPSPITGMRIWQTDTNEEYYYNGSSWILFKEAPKFIVKTVNEVKNNTDSLNLDDELFCDVRASALYMLDAFLIYSASASGSIKFGISLPAGATINWSHQAPGTGTVDRDHVSIAWTGNHTQAQGIGYLGFGTGANAVGWIRDLPIDVGPTPGRVGITWAQATAENSDCTLRVNSYLHVRRVVT